MDKKKRDKFFSILYIINRIFVHTFNYVRVIKDIITKNK